MTSTQGSLLERLREDILSGKHPPGRALIQEELSDHYGVSRIPIREALHRLESEGFVSPEGKRGTIVSRLDATEAEDITLMRVRLEPLALELAFPQLSKAQLGRAEDILDRMEAAPTTQHGSLNADFHRSLYEKSERPRLLHTLAGLHLHADRYMRYTFGVLGHQARSHEEHLELLRALREGRLEEAKETLSQHILYAGERLVEALRTQLRE